MPAELDLATVEVARFEPLLHERFSARLWEAPPGPPAVELELVRATPYHLGGPGGQRAPFSLIFAGPAGVTLEQSLYTLDHPQTGGMLLFLVPVARKEGRIQLQAVFN